MRQLKEFSIPAEKSYLDRVRDVFRFCCVTGLRYSDAFNLRRADIKEDHIEVTTQKALREAIVNTIIHARLTAMHCIVIEHYPDKFVFRNPGCLLVSVEQYFEGGTSICRNSILQKMFEFIGEGERAGSGVDTIKKGWASNKWPEPVIRELYDPEQVELTLFLGGTTTKTTTTTTRTTTKEQMLGKKLVHIGPTNGGHWEIIK